MRIFPIGKYKGQTVKQIIQKDPGYIMWFINNVERYSDALLDQLNNYSFKEGEFKRVSFSSKLKKKRKKSKQKAKQKQTHPSKSFEQLEEERKQLRKQIPPMPRSKIMEDIGFTYNPERRRYERFKQTQ